jgi:hypothetical protein
VFCAVQDRITAEGARRYVALQREAAARHRPRVSIDEVMQPAIADSVRRGAAWSSGIMAAGLIAARAGRKRAITDRR